MKATLHLYLRVSSSIQVEGTSLKTQKEIGIALAKKLGMSYEIHNEGGKSSAKDDLENRPIMMNLLKLMDKGIVKHLYVWNTDRLSRNQITWYSIRQKMVKNEVILYTPKGIHNPQDDMENMILGILSEVSQYDNKIRTERSRLGKFEKVKMNYWRGGDCAFGFKLEHDGVGNKLAENKEESKWVKYIFSEYSKGKTLIEIRGVLEKNKIRTRRGNKLWSLGSMQVMLKNELYKGIAVYFDKKSKQTITNTVPQIISNKLFELVSDRRKQLLLRKGQMNRTEKFYLFRDFLICGGCNSPMGGKIKPTINVNSYYCPITERKFIKLMKEMCPVK
ncbi:MAG: recombinase family protein [Cytophagaceae bacterium]|nr:recombinase family protein [Cytophagaceae bacterium]